MMERTRKTLDRRRLGRELTEALAIGVAACLVIVLLLTPVLLFLMVETAPSQSGAVATGDRVRQVITAWDAVRVTVITPVVETLPFLIVMLLLRRSPLRARPAVVLMLFLGLSFSYGFFAHGGGLWNVGRGLVFTAFGWQFARFADRGRMKAAFWLTTLAHAAYNASALVIYFVGGLVRPLP